jgi:hypothetical protein
MLEAMGTTRCWYRDQVDLLRCVAQQDCSVGVPTMNAAYHSIIIFLYAWARYVQIG